MMLLLAVLGCSQTYMEFSGTVSDTSFTPITGFFGGEYIIFFNEEIDCTEMYLVTKIYRNGDAPYDNSIKAVQITYNDSEVVGGTYSTGGDAPITAQFLNIEGDSFTLTKATEGTLIVDEVVSEGTVEGSFNFAFGDDAMEGSFNVPWCTNLVH